MQVVPAQNLKSNALMALLIYSLFYIAKKAYIY
jgi:hypothetical protein